ncbi:unnamed protein product [Eruca vesicaria subsp. sativa]|uniref:Uncharacterized protein n=1 Tax=Eruca vesicaria subsp. sativa TaxID=29727 RepID=A0ABC8M0B0_ERUVS|nr:unnamed protein product [Eruca vesicaria subsp. sativa]
MSHLLRRLKLSLLRRNLITSTCSRCFSSCPPIYYVRGGETWGAVSSEKISIPSLKVPMESLKEIGIIGASHGWVATLKNGVEIDKEGNAVYTKDIGPLCIFLSKSEAFCIPSKTNLITRVRNSVYMLTDHEFAIVKIDSNQKFPSSPFGSRLPYYIISKED